MTVLRVYRDDNDPESREEYTSFADIVRVASEAGIRVERWVADRELPPDASPEAILDAYRVAVARIKQERGFATADVVAMTPDHPNHAEVRRKFLQEHTHSEDEARFFVDGSGVFTIHAGPSVLAVQCEKGDLINVPAGTRHWFDMGPAPRFKCIRLFTDTRGWVADFTGSDIADRFPSFGV
jgi:1,2-dihydroxy-3-keto-5-methylthiopentene dioxygenase